MPEYSRIAGSLSRRKQYVMFSLVHDSLTASSRVTVALEHPLLRDGGLLSPLMASLAQWHLLDDPEEDHRLTDALKGTLREADRVKRALAQVRDVQCAVVSRACKS